MKVEFSAFPKAFSGNVAAFVAADKQLLATAQSINTDAGGTVARAIDASRFTGAKGQSLTVLGQAGNIARLRCSASARTASSMRGPPRLWAASSPPKPMPPARRQSPLPSIR